MVDKVEDKVEVEKWRMVKEAPNYEVSNIGRVRNKFSGHMFSLRPKKNGYVQVQLSCASKSKFRYVHRLVATMFIPNECNKLCVNHIDCDKTNNKVENLEWCTYKENNNHPPTLKLLRKMGKKRRLNAIGYRKLKSGSFNIHLRVLRKHRVSLTFKKEKQARDAFLQARAIRNTLDEILPAKGIVQIIYFAILSKSK